MKRYPLVALLVVLAIPAAVWVSPVKTQDLEKHRWQYCAVGMGKMKKGIITVTVKYLTPTGARVEAASLPGQSRVTSTEVVSANDLEEDAFYAAIAKLGAEGWEMVGVAPRWLQMGDGANMQVYFKRPAP